jgi:pimeloyl-ACP methyl ester carboxylesterase
VRIWITTLLLTLAPVAMAGPIQLKGADAATLQAADQGTGTRGVVLVHAEGRTSADWSNFAGKLASQGFRVVTFDLRGHGANTAAGPMTDAEWAKVPGDIAAAAAYLRSKGAQEVSLIGAEIGGSLALRAGADDPAVTTVVMISPTLSAHGVKVSEALTAYGKRPLFLVAASGDTMSAKAATLLQPKALGIAELELLDGAGSGAALLNIDPALQGNLFNWLAGSTWRPKATDAEKAAVGPATTTTIDTKGTKLEDAP